MNINVVYLVTVFVISICSVILHELAHGLMAYALGDQTAKLSGRLSLNPLKHIDPVMSIIVPVVLALVGAPIFGGAKPVPINTRNLKWGEWGFALVALAGPLMNILLAFIFFLVGNMTGVLVNEGGSLGYYEVIGGIVCSTGLLLNLGFALFNIIPIPPLDGSRILYALAPDFARNFMRNIEQYGLVIIYGLIFFCSSLFSAYLMSGQAMFINFFFWIVGVR